MSIAGPAGGGGGKEFNDEASIAFGSSVVEVRIWAGSVVDAVQMVLRNSSGVVYELPKHGGGGGNLQVFSLEAGEHVQKIYGKYGSLVDRVHIVTDRREIGSAGGNGGSSEFSFEASNNGQHILGFFGRAGEPPGGKKVFVDAIGIVYH